MGLIKRAKYSSEFLTGKLTLKKVELFLDKRERDSKETIQVLKDAGYAYRDFDIEYPQEIIDGVSKRLSTHQIQCYESNPIYHDTSTFETKIYAIFRHGSDIGIRIFYNPSESRLMPQGGSRMGIDGPILAIHIGEFSRPFCKCFGGHLNMSNNPDIPTPEAVAAKILSLFEF